MTSKSSDPNQTSQAQESFAFNTGSNKESIKCSIRNHLKYTLARDEKTAHPRDWCLATSYAIRDRILERFLKTQLVHSSENVRRTYYFSLEYLMGRLMSNNLHNMGLWETTKQAIEELGVDFNAVMDEEVDMGLGNGGLGRLAACFLDSLATLGYPAIGYGIHYEFGLFRQEFISGHQVEHPDNWLKGGTPWQIIRSEYCQEIPLYGEVKDIINDRGDWSLEWTNTKKFIGVPWDIVIVGNGGNTVNFLRLWESRSSEEFDLKTFNEGGYVEAVREKAIGETISKVLYPNDTTEAGKELRLVQQYFFAACSLKDIIRRFKKKNTEWEDLPKKAVIQLNDTHPAIAIVELMRILIDEEMLPWQKAWEICTQTFAYTNHTLLPEALEKWSVTLFEKVLPRHLNIIYEINRQFLENAVEKHWPGDSTKKKTLSIIEEGSPKMIRMAYLANVASFSINGVAALHTELLKSTLFNEFYELSPEKFNNKTNGITPRRWLKVCNPRLSAFLTQKTGNEEWVKDITKLKKLEEYVNDEGFQKAFMQIKHENKAQLANTIHKVCGISVDPNAIFDVQVKRIHEYKRQHLNLLHIMTLYYRLLHDPSYNFHPRVFIFGGKAAPGYAIAKEIIYAINAVGKKINNDSRIRDKLKVVFFPNYGVTSAMEIMPAADLSEQISTAGKEASGTGNMKLALNGALTIGTLDGANIEIKEEVGEENIFIFGLTVEEVNKLKYSGYNPFDYYKNNNELKTVIDWLGSDFFEPSLDKGFINLIRSLLYEGDPYMVLADYEAYCKAQEAVNAAYEDKTRWAKMAILNTARTAKFSSDRTIHEYAKEIWKINPLSIPD